MRFSAGISALKHVASRKTASALAAAAVLTIAACGASKNSGLGANPTDSGQNKPEAADFSGNAGSFSGQWQGKCSYYQNGRMYTSCTATLNITQDANSSSLMGTLTYIAGNQSYAPAQIQRLDIDHNSLKQDNVVIGQIGKSGLEFYSTSFGDFTARLFNASSMGINVAQLPLLTNGSSCPNGFCFTAALTRASQTVTNPTF